MNGYLENPEFGDIPDHKLERPLKTFEFEPSINIVRQHPNSWAKIAVYKMQKSRRNFAGELVPMVGSDDTRKAVLNQKARVWRWLLNNHPLERWDVAVRKTPETWGDRELWVRFLGNMTPEEALAAKEQRHEAWAIRQQKAEQNVAKKRASQRLREELQAKKRQDLPTTGG